MFKNTCRYLNVKSERLDVSEELIVKGAGELDGVETQSSSTAGGCIFVRGTPELSSVHRSARARVANKETGAVLFAAASKPRAAIHMER